MYYNFTFYHIRILVKFKVLVQVTKARGGLKVEFSTFLTSMYIELNNQFYASMALP
jgi:hypothetical protein